jgi:CRISPR-associated protein Cas1
MIGVGMTTASLYKCFSGEIRKISYPTMEWLNALVNTK